MTQDSLLTQLLVFALVTLGLMNVPARAFAQDIVITRPNRMALGVELQGGLCHYSNYPFSGRPMSVVVTVPENAAAASVQVSFNAETLMGGGNSSCASSTVLPARTFSLVALRDGLFQSYSLFDPNAQLTVVVAWCSDHLPPPNCAASVERTQRVRVGMSFFDRTTPGVEHIYNFHYEGRAIQQASSIVFREKSGDNKDGTWGFFVDEIPNWDHVGLNAFGTVFESHPGYPAATYVSKDGLEIVSVETVNGVQSQHSRGTFEHDSTVTTSSPVTDFAEFEISSAIADSMSTAIESVRGWTFRFIDYFSFEGIRGTLAPLQQKGAGGSFTCVGLIEWAAEVSGVNGGEGFIPNSMESVSVVDPRDPTGHNLEIPLLSPWLLSYALETSDTLDAAREWVFGFFDPVDFVLTDPLGRRLGFVAGGDPLNEIPYAGYTGNGRVEQFFVSNAVPGPYVLTLSGTGDHVFGAFGHSSQAHVVDLPLVAGEQRVTSFFVEPRVGSVGDVNLDGAVSWADVLVLTSQVGSQANPSDPGDIDVDGSISPLDVEALTRLVEVLTGADNVPPALSVPSDTSVEASGAAGTVVEYAVSAVDLVDGSIPVSCSPSSGSTFPLGTTRVSCLARDSAGNASNASFLVTVRDSTPPLLLLPDGLAVRIPGSVGAYVSFVATAEDLVSGSRQVNCQPASGSFFALGISIVQCTAADALGNMASGSFTVSVSNKAQLEPPVFGPKRYVAAGTAVEVFREAFAARPGPAILGVTWRDPNGLSSHVVVRLNGVELTNGSDAAGGAGTILWPVVLENSNSLEIVITGNAGTEVMVKVIQ